MGNSRRIAQPCTVMYIVRYAIMLSAVLGLKLDSKDGKESEFVNYGRRASPSPGEMRVATLSIKGVSSQAYSNSFPQQPIYLSVLKPPGGYGSHHESFNFFLRDFEDAVIGQGHKVGFSLQFSGIDSRGQNADVRGYDKPINSDVLGPQLKYEGHEVKKIVDTALINRCWSEGNGRGEDHWTSEECVKLKETPCFTTSKFMMGKFRDEWMNNNNEKYDPDDPDTSGCTDYIPEEFRGRNGTYFDVNYFEGCLITGRKMTNNDVRPPRVITRPITCLTCQELRELSGIPRVRYGGTPPWFLENGDDCFTKYFSKLEDAFKNDYPECYPRFQDYKGQIIDSTKYPDILCDKGVNEALNFWKRQEKKYLPGCSLMLDRAAEPWRMSGICDGVVSVEFDVEPHTDFWSDVQSESDYEYFAGNNGGSRQQYSQYQYSQHSSRTATQIHYLKWLVMLGLMLLGLAALFNRKRSHEA